MPVLPKYFVKFCENFQLKMNKIRENKSKESLKRQCYMFIIFPGKGWTRKYNFYFIIKLHPKFTQIIGEIGTLENIFSKNCEKETDKKDDMKNYLISHVLFDGNENIKSVNKEQKLEMQKEESIEKVKK